MTEKKKYFTSTNRLSLRKIEVYLSSQVYIKGSLGDRVSVFINMFVTPAFFHPFNIVLFPSWKEDDATDKILKDIGIDDEESEEDSDVEELYELDNSEKDD